MTLGTLLLYLWCALMHLLATLLAYLLSVPLGMLSVAMGWTTLPGPLRHLHTTDDDLDGGQRQLGWDPKKGLALAWQRSRWIRRNPASGVAAYVLGVAAEDYVLRPVVGGLRWDGYGTRYAYRLLAPNGNKMDLWGYRADLQWCPWFYAKVWVGWSYETRQGRHRLQFQFNPFRKVPRDA